jgi:hypothetical protein
MDVDGGDLKQIAKTLVAAGICESELPKVAELYQKLDGALQKPSIRRDIQSMAQWNLKA